MNNVSTSNIIQDNGEEPLDLKNIFSNLWDKWFWFLSSIVIFSLIAFLYTRYTPPAYQISAKILVNDDEKGSSLAKQSNGLMDLGGL
jgi:uncharacterized protein involved in exopolysaccharide biosynthesis